MSPDRYGTEGSQLVIALHGSPANRAMWLPLARVLPPGFELWAPDLPGHGARRSERFTIDGALAEIARLLAAAARPAIVVGDSLGGYLALAAGARLPGIAAVVAGGCTFEMHGVASSLAFASDAPLRLALRLVGEARLEGLLARALPHVVGADFGRAVAAAGVRLAARSESIRALAQMHVAHEVASLRPPVVFVNGSRDWPTRAHERRFLALAPQAELVLAPGAPHGVSVAAPAVFARALVRAAELAAHARLR